MRSWMLLAAGLSLSALMGCGDKDDDDDDDGDDSGDGDTGVVCGSTQGFVYGTVSGPYSDDPNANATVWAVTADSSPVAAEMAGDGTYEVNLEGGDDYWIYAQADDCYSADIELTVAECTEYPIDIHIDECDVADKPNLYIYPKADQRMLVEVEHGDRQKIVASDPPHGDRGWHGIAHADGTFTQNGDRAPFLFYEVSLAPWQGRSLQRDTGFCVWGKNPVAQMAGILEDYGFNAVEVDDFVEGWRHDLPPAQAYSVFPQHDVDHIAGLRLRPQVPVERLWLLVEEGSGCAPLYEPVIQPLDRRGAHAVEWGVVLHGLGR